MVGVDDTAFTGMKKKIILSVLTQMARLLVVKEIHPFCLKYEDEEIEDFIKVKPENILIRWVNHHLKEAGQDLRINNLGEDIADSEAMTYVLHQLDSKTSLSPLSEKNPIKRANQMIHQSKLIGVSEVCQGKDIIKGNKNINTIFVAEVFNTCHGLQITQ